MTRLLTAAAFRLPFVDVAVERYAAPADSPWFDHWRDGPDHFVRAGGTQVTWARTGATAD